MKAPCRTPLDSSQSIGAAAGCQVMGIPCSCMHAHVGLRPVAYHTIWHERIGATACPRACVAASHNHSQQRQLVRACMHARVCGPWLTSGCGAMGMEKKGRRKCRRASEVPSTALASLSAGNVAHASSAARARVAASRYSATSAAATSSRKPAVQAHRTVPHHITACHRVPQSAWPPLRW